MKPWPLFVLVATVATAQPSATMRPALLASVDVTTSFSSEEEIARGATLLGELAVQHFAVSASGRTPLSAETNLLYGAAYSVHVLDASTALPLPDRLAELSLNVGVRHQLNPQWTVSVFLRPGFYSDFEDLDGKSFNVPLLALASYGQSRDLIWSFGLSANAFNERAVMPVVGVNWRINPAWSFSVGFPRSGFAWRATEKLTARAGVGFQGGNFRITQNLGPAPGGARLANTYVDFREVRAGVGLDYEFSDAVTLTLDLGAVTDRKFDYFDKDYRLDGDSGLYGALGVKASF